MKSLPGNTGSRKGSSGKSFREQYILFAILFVLIFGTVTMVVLLPQTKDEVPIDGQYPEVHVVNDGAAKLAHDRFKDDEKRLEKMIDRISKREKRLEALLDRLGEDGQHELKKAEREEWEREGEGERVPVLGRKELLPPKQNQVIEEEKHEYVQPNLHQKATQKVVQEDTHKLLAVKHAMEHAWGNYRQNAWGMDELMPLSNTGKNWLGFGATIVDSLDTLWIMGLKDEFKEARDWIEHNLHFDDKGHVSFFETTIRALGGLLSAYHFSDDQMFLNKAEDLGKRLMKAFNTQHGLPYGSVNLRTGDANSAGWLSGRTVLSEVGTVQLEFLYLAYATNNPSYATPALKVFQHIDRIKKPPGCMGLHSLYLSLGTGEFTGGRWSMGALGDSFYEYLLKMYLFTGSQFEGFRRMYDESSDIMHNTVLTKSKPSSLTFINEIENGRLHPKMDHLACFSGGMFALGANGNTFERDFTTGSEMTRTCHEMYARMETGIAPEIVMFGKDNDFWVKPRDKHYLLRPETVESFFVLYRLTGDQKYRDWGWEVFQSIEKYCRTEGGYSGIRDVTNTNVEHDNQQQSFFLAETLKYLYLLFASSDVVSLDEYVFNTEAHPLPITRNWGVEYSTHFPPANK